jgi:hypothetical protein
MIFMRLFGGYFTFRELPLDLEVAGGEGWCSLDCGELAAVA